MLLLSEALPVELLKVRFCTLRHARRIAESTQSAQSKQQGSRCHNQCHRLGSHCLSLALVLLLTFVGRREHRDSVATIPVTAATARGDVILCLCMITPLLLRWCTHRPCSMLVVFCICCWPRCAASMLVLGSSFSTSSTVYIETKDKQSTQKRNQSAGVGWWLLIIQLAGSFFCHSP